MARGAGSGGLGGAVASEKTAIIRARARTTRAHGDRRSQRAGGAESLLTPEGPRLTRPGPSVGSRARSAISLPEANTLHKSTIRPGAHRLGGGPSEAGGISHLPSPHERGVTAGPENRRVRNQGEKGAQDPAL